MGYPKTLANRYCVRKAFAFVLRNATVANGDQDGFAKIGD